jgi:superfamily II DNA or RNA helicase
MQDYQTFLEQKRITAAPAGFVAGEITPALFPYQRDVVRWTTQRGRAAIFSRYGTGKTPMQLEWARHVCAHTGGNVLILAPLAVAQQTRREGEKFGIAVHVCRSQADVQSGINIANYEMLPHFDASTFAGVVLDESSILKSYDGKTRTAIIDAFSRTPYRLACTATPAPNDHMELGNHAEFLGIMSRTEMLATFFTHDGGDTSKWRLKGHAEAEFWKWVCSWAVMLRKPSDLGYSDEGFDLPPLRYHQITVDIAHQEQAAEGAQLYLMPVEAMSLIERRNARKVSLTDRVASAADLVNASSEAWIVWCNLNAESEALTTAIPGAVQVTGSDSQEHKERAMLDFASGQIRVLITKPSICGFGMNWQHCHNEAFVGLSDSFEELDQAIHRCHRYGQQHAVDVYIITSELEGAVVRNIERKRKDHEHMTDQMIEQMRDLNTAAVQGLERETMIYATSRAAGANWTIHLGDCVDVVRGIEDGSIDYSIFSPPFASLYTYTNSDRDMGNCRDETEFYQHFVYLVRELYRVIKPGRLLSFHCMNLPASKTHDGYIGIKDFRGDLIRMFQEAGFIFHSEVCIWKDPVTAMQRTKAIGLLYKQLKKDSALSRQGIPDYLVTMRKPGVNPDPITKDPADFPVDLWQRYASPVWFDINQSNTLQKESAREQKDEKHICPLQIDVIERAVDLWTNAGDLVLSPFTGIGSEGFVSVQMGRRFVGAELKQSYYKQAVANLERAEREKAQPTLFDLIDSPMDDQAIDGPRTDPPEDFEGEYPYDYRTAHPMDSKINSERTREINDGGYRYTQVAVKTDAGALVWVNADEVEAA